MHRGMVCGLCCLCGAFVAFTPTSTHKKDVFFVSSWSIYKEPCLSSKHYVGRMYSWTKIQSTNHSNHHTHGNGWSTIENHEVLPQHIRWYVHWLRNVCIQTNIPWIGSVGAYRQDPNTNSHVDGVRSVDTWPIGPWINHPWNNSMCLVESRRNRAGFSHKENVDGSVIQFRWIQFKTVQH